MIGIGEFGDNDGVDAGVEDGVDNIIVLIDEKVHGVTAAVAHLTAAVISENQVDTIGLVARGEIIGFNGCLNRLASVVNVVIVDALSTPSADKSLVIFFMAA